MKEHEDTIREFLIERSWHNLKPANLAKSISIESSELLEIFQWTDQSLEEVKNDSQMMEQIKKELADVLNYCFNMSVLLGLDTGQIMKDKLEKAKEKYPAHLFKDRNPAQDAGSENVYWEIKREYRQKGE